jgi:hypothetical protein
VTLSGNTGLDGAFTISSNVNNDNDVGTATYRIDFRSTSGITFDNNDTVSVVINGVTYTSDGSNAGNNEGQYYDDAVASLQSALSAAGFSISNIDTSNDRFDVTGPITSAASALVTLDGTADSTSTVNLQSSLTPSNQSAPTVDTTQQATDAEFSVTQYGDTLIGGAGDDTLTGGTGADVYKWNLNDSGNDTVTDFNQGSGSFILAEGDKLNLADLLTSPIDASHLSIADDGGNVLIQFSASGDLTNDVTQSITLENVTLQALQLDSADLATKLAKLQNGDFGTTT